MNRAQAAAVLVLRLLVAMGAAGVQTTRTLLRARGTSVRPGFVRIAYAPLTPTGAVLLAAMVTLTPGTTVIEIDLAHHELWLHMLDVSQRDAVTRQVQRDFAPALCAWCGARA